MDLIKEATPRLSATVGATVGGGPYPPADTYRPKLCRALDLRTAQLVDALSILANTIGDDVFTVGAIKSDTGEGGTEDDAESVNRLASRLQQHVETLRAVGCLAVDTLREYAMQLAAKEAYHRRLRLRLNETLNKAGAWRTTQERTTAPGRGGLAFPARDVDLPLADGRGFLKSKERS